MADVFSFMRRHRKKAKLWNDFRDAAKSFDPIWDDLDDIADTGTNAEGDDDD